MTFKQGQVVRCVATSDVGHVGIVGHEYIVESDKGALNFRSTGDPGSHLGCSPERFVEVSGVTIPPTEASPENLEIIRKAACPHLPGEPAIRKMIPLATGLLDYFPDALAAVAALSYAATAQHHPGEPCHWDRNKSADEADTLLRHFLDRGTVDTDGQLHSVKVAWRALALLQKELEGYRADHQAALEAAAG